MFALVRNKPSTTLKYFISTVYLSTSQPLHRCVLTCVVKMNVCAKMWFNSCVWMLLSHFLHDTFTYVYLLGRRHVRKLWLEPIVVFAGLCWDSLLMLFSMCNISFHMSRYISWIPYPVHNIMFHRSFMIIVFTIGSALSRSPLHLLHPLDLPESQR